MAERDLHELLDERREAVERLPGVTGTAIGASLQRAETHAVHVYVTPGTDVERVRSEAERLLDDAPVEVIDMETPQAH